jgi:nicotinamidase-related amidase
VSAWDEPRIREAVSAAGRTKLIIAGGAPEYSLAPSALAAADAGYDVYAAVDLSSSSANRRHAVRMFRAGVIVIDPALLVAELAGGRGDSDAAFRGRHDGRFVARA